LPLRRPINSRDLRVIAAMPQVATEQQWKSKYRELVDELEDKERAWSRLEAALRAACGKLAMAALGQSPELDAAIDHVMAVLRTDPTTLNLESSMTGLMRALKAESAVEAKSAPPKSPVVIVPTASAVTDEIVSLLRALVRRLAEMPPLAETAATLARRIEIGVPENGWEPFLRSVADAVGEVVTALEAKRRELEVFLEQVTQQLAEFEDFTRWQAGAAQSRRDDAAGLELTVQTEIVHLQREVVASPDLVYLKTKVQTRLDNVARELVEFRRKEDRRRAEDERRASELKNEVSKLKGRTDELIKLCAEQETRLMIDSLTGAHSRYAYERRLEEEFRRWQRHSQPLSFSIWDIDLFKGINDSYGHEAGDRLLRGVTDLFGRHKRAEDFLARIGGEEFVLLLPMTSLEAAQAVADKLRAAVDTAAFRHHGEPVHVTVSAGLTEFRLGDTPTTVYERADGALYQAKQQGRNRCFSS
jgi:diguanylate cyclase